MLSNILRECIKIHGDSNFTYDIEMDSKFNEFIGRIDAFMKAYGVKYKIVNDGGEIYADLGIDDRTGHGFVQGLWDSESKVLYINHNIFKDQRLNTLSKVVLVIIHEIGHVFSSELFNLPDNPGDIELAFEELFVELFASTLMSKYDLLSKTALDETREQQFSYIESIKRLISEVDSTTLSEQSKSILKLLSNYHDGITSDELELNINKRIKTIVRIMVETICEA